VSARIASGPRGSHARAGCRPAAIVRGSAVVVTLAAATFGLPVALYWLGGSPIPDRLPSLHAMTFVLLHRDNGSLFLGAVRDISWLAWAAFTIAVLAETQATLRGRPAPRLRLAGLQVAAAKLVAVASVSFTGPVGATLAAAPVAAAAVLQAHVQPTVGSVVQPIALDALVTPVVSHEIASHRVVVVRPGDCLWTIAEHYLGSGERYPELVRLNLGHDMGDGQVLSDPSLIMAGWRLRLPNLPGTTARPGDAGSDPEPHHRGHPSGGAHFRAPHRGAGAENHSASGSGSGAGQGTGSDPSAGSGGEPQASGAGAGRNHAQAGQHEEVEQTVLFTLGMIAGAALVCLERLRHRQRQNRRAGRRIALPSDADGRRIEQKLRAAAPLAPPTSLRDALCDLSAGVAEGGNPLPPIVGIHLTANVLEVLLSAPATGPPPPPFSIAPGREGMCWTASFGDAPPGWATVPPVPGEAGDLLPGLFTAGLSEADGYLLLDLEAMRVTCCDGPRELADRLLVTAATELAASRWSGWYELVLAGCDELDVLGRAERCRDLDEALGLLETRVRTVAQRLHGDRDADIRTRRIEDPEDEDWGLTLLVSRHRPTPQQMSRLLDIADRPGGIAALVAGDTQADDGRLAPAVFSLEPDPDGPGGMIATITLGYLGPQHQLTVWPQTLTVSEYEALTGLFATAAETSDVSPDASPYEDFGGPPWMRFAAAPVVPDADEILYGPVNGPEPIEPEPNAPEPNTLEPNTLEPNTLEPNGPEPRPIVELPDAEPTPKAPAGHARPSPRVNVLGPFEVVGVAEPLHPKQAELVLALALHSPVGLSNSALCTLLGADADHPKPADSVRQLITRTRRRLGRASDGREHIIHLGSGIYVLHDDVRLDWADFSALAGRGRADRNPADLRAALELVSGQPFHECYHWWIDIALIETMRAEIVDTAGLLARLELAAGQPQAAGRAARIGLSAESAAEPLWRTLMQAEHAAGNPVGVTDAWTACLDAITEIAPGAEPHPDTERLFRELSGGPKLTLPL
jgi:DNA-binding SARP family transcriptional activator